MACNHKQNHSIKLWTFLNFSMRYLLKFFRFTMILLIRILRKMFDQYLWGTINIFFKMLVAENYGHLGTSVLDLSRFKKKINLEKNKNIKIQIQIIFFSFFFLKIKIKKIWSKSKSKIKSKNKIKNLKIKIKLKRTENFNLLIIY